MSTSPYFPPLIGINGDFEAGKDEIAKVLCRQYGYVRVALGDFVKDTCHRLVTGMLATPGDFPASIRAILALLRSDPTAVFRKPTSDPVRQLLQFVGTDYFRAQDPDHWVKAFDVYVLPILASGGRVVAPDMRFDNEGEYIAAHGGEEWGVIRPGLNPSEFRQHASERSYTRTPDCLIENTGTLGLLECRVIDALQGCSARRFAREDERREKVA